MLARLELILFEHTFVGGRLSAEGASNGEFVFTTMKTSSTLWRSNRLVTTVDVHGSKDILVWKPLKMQEAKMAKFAMKPAEIPLDSTEVGV